MLFDIDTRRQDVTANAVTLTLKLDAEYCHTLGNALLELGHALLSAERTHKTAKRFKADEPLRKANRLQQRAVIASRVRELNLPGRKAVSVIAREFGLSYDTTDLIISEIRRDERHEAARRRDEEFDKLSKSGFDAKSIAERLKLSIGTVRNILSRRNRSVLRPASATDKAV